MSKLLHIEFTKLLWKHGKPIFKKILTGPFIHGLQTGQLPKEKFINFLQQDILYLPKYAETMRKIAKRLNHEKFSPYCEEFAQTALNEIPIHKNYLDKENIPAEGYKASIICKGYIQHLIDTVHHCSIEEAVSAAFPCFLFYQKIGEALLQTVNDISTHPYQHWLKQYSTDELLNGFEKMKDLTNYVAENSEKQNLMIKAFITSAEWEEKFFRQNMIRNDKSFFWKNKKNLKKIDQLHRKEMHQLSK